MVINDTSITKTALIFFLVGLLCGGVVGRGTAEKGADGKIITTDTITRYDTLLVKSPTARDSIVVKYITKTLPKSGNNSVENIPQIGNIQGDNIPVFAEVADSDSVAVEIPITQKRYDGDDYRAYVSGYEPNLDSIFVFPKSTVIHERSYKPPNKWHIGITGGYGYGFKNQHSDLYIGIGITYSIISF